MSDEAATLALGKALAGVLHPGLVIHLCGELGSGKTTLVRGVLLGLGFSGKVKSPSYTLVELYAISNLDCYHFDFYRFGQPEEFLDAGLVEYFRPTALCLVEWPEKAGNYCPAPDLRLTLAVAEDGRDARLVAITPGGAACLSNLRARMTP